MSSPVTIMAAAATAEPEVGVVVVTGLVVVFAVLILLYLLISLEGVIFGALDKRKSGSKPEPTKQTPQQAVSLAPVGKPAAPVIEKGISAEVVAAISAAITCMEGGESFTIRTLTRAKKGRSAWGGAAMASYTEPF